jgi:hypothetical protein
MQIKYREITLKINVKSGWNVFVRVRVRVRVNAIYAMSLWFHGVCGTKKSAFCSATSMGVSKFDRLGNKRRKCLKIGEKAINSNLDS